MSGDSQWRPIETAPKDGTSILICGFGGANKYFVADVKWNEGEWCLFDPAEDLYSWPCYGPSHWMPLPAPPAALGQD